MMDMRKYIDAEKLIAEIERLKEETPIGICEYDKGEENGRYEVLNHLLSTITSLQQEQPELDLEKAAEQYSQNILAGGEDMFDAIADGFIAGAKWDEEQMKKNAVDGHCFVSPVDSSVLFVQTEHFENKKGFRHGETCKVIVLKSLSPKMN